MPQAPPKEFNFEQLVKIATWLPFKGDVLS
jgi:hypothetical protein